VHASSCQANDSRRRSHLYPLGSMPSATPCPLVQLAPTGPAVPDNDGRGLPWPPAWCCISSKLTGWRRRVRAQGNDRCSATSIDQETEGKIHGRSNTHKLLAVAGSATVLHDWRLPSGSIELRPRFRARVTDRSAAM
jgi:hypothetical protein